MGARRNPRKINVHICMYMYYMFFYYIIYIYDYIHKDMRYIPFVADSSRDGAGGGGARVRHGANRACKATHSRRARGTC